MIKRKFKFVTVNNKDEMQKVIESRNKLRNMIEDKALKQRMTADMMDKAINQKTEITDIQEKILFNENLD